jgi:hypothetical protein
VLGSRERINNREGGDGPIWRRPRFRTTRGGRGVSERASGRHRRVQITPFVRFLFVILRQCLKPIRRLTRFLSISLSFFCLSLLISPLVPRGRDGELRGNLPNRAYKFSVIYNACFDGRSLYFELFLFRPIN